jgi:hypothetical protein
MGTGLFLHPYTKRLYFAFYRFLLVKFSVNEYFSGLPLHIHLFEYIQALLLTKISQFFSFGNIDGHIIRAGVFANHLTFINIFARIHKKFTSLL